MFLEEFQGEQITPREPAEASARGGEVSRELSNPVRTFSQVASVESD